MPERARYQSGTPAWVDLMSPDVDASIKFYGNLFGWKAAALGSVETLGGYRQFTLGGKSVCGVGPLREGARTWWTSYISVDDVDDAVRNVVKAGGELLMKPADVTNAGRLAIFSDTVGAIIAVWQPETIYGAELMSEPATLTWNELATRTPAVAKEFYGEVFGWSSEDRELPSGHTYTHWMLNGRRVGGMRVMDDLWPAAIPSHWTVYFGSEDVDATTRLAERLGGKVTVPAQDIGPGRFAVLNDPHGAVFSVVTLNDWPT